MDPIARNQKYFREVDEKLSCFLKHLHGMIENHSHVKEAERELKEILRVAQQIGGSFLVDVQALQRDFVSFLKQPENETATAKMIADTMRIKHEIREL
ncbi:MAG: hypothetical protein KGJ02_00655 [Verrucomicrobiota bacterium]|nr:hypothetical protein [Verrucomicrobiota bacterium]